MFYYTDQYANHKSENIIFDSKHDMSIHTIILIC